MFKLVILDNNNMTYCQAIIFQQYPPKKGFIRGISYFTGYLVRRIDDRRCQLTYISQSDPRGKYNLFIEHHKLEFIYKCILKPMRI